MKHPYISVLMCIYKESIDLIKESIESILNQTFLNYEFIIVIDNPDLDSSVGDYLNSLKKIDSRIVIAKNDSNIGLALSLNKGFSLSKGNYIARMDADDISLSNRFEKELLYLENSDYDMVCSSVLLINDSSSFIDKAIMNADNLIKGLQHSNVIYHPSVMIRRSVLSELGGYRNFRKSQDYDLWLRMLSKGYKIGVIEEPLIKYRLKKGERSANNSLEQFLSNNYQKKLFKERKKLGRDSFSEEHFQLFLKRKHFTNRNKKRFSKCVFQLERAKEKINKRNLSFVFNICRAFFIYPSVCVNCIFNNLRKKRK